MLIRLLGREHAPLEALASRAASVEVLLKSMSGVRDVRNDHRLRPSVEVKPNQEVAALLGLSVEQINGAVSHALDGRRIAELDLGGDEPLDVRICGTQDQRNSVEDLESLTLRGADEAGGRPGPGCSRRARPGT